jgi:hypothetical protein
MMVFGGRKPLLQEWSFEECLDYQGGLRHYEETKIL